MASLSYLPNTSSQRRVSLQQIDSVVVERLGGTRGLGKSQPACFNRQVAMYLASHVGRWSTTSIGRFYGGRDHSTVVHSIQRIQRLRVSNPEIEGLLRELQARLEDEVKEPNHRFGKIATVKVDSDWEIIADHIALRVCELLQEELRAPSVETRILGQPEGKERLQFPGMVRCFVAKEGSS